MGNYLWLSFTIEDEMRNLENEIQQLRNQNQMLEDRCEASRQEKAVLENEKEELREHYLNAIEQSVSLIDANNTLRSEIEMLNNLG